MQGRCHALVEIGVEVSEQMDVIPQQARVLQHHRIEYACPCCDQSLTVARSRGGLDRQDRSTQPVAAHRGRRPVRVGKTPPHSVRLVPAPIRLIAWVAAP